MKNDQPLPSLFAKGKNRKKKQTKKEKIISIVGIAVAAAALLLAFGIIIFSVVNSQNDRQDIRGYWYSEDGTICWHFDKGYMRVYALLDNEYTLRKSGSFDIDAGKRQLTARFTSGAVQTFVYELNGDDLSIGVDTPDLSLHRGKAFD